MHDQDGILESDILLNKPVIKGTRLTVDFLLNLLAQGWTKEQILENYPSLNAEILQRVIALKSNN